MTVMKLNFWLNQKGVNKTSRFRMIFLVILVCLLTVSARVSQQTGFAAESIEFWYYAEGQQVNLPLSRQELAVRFSQGLVAEDKVDVLEGIVGIHNIPSLTELQAPLLTILEFEASLDETEYLEILEDLRSGSKVAFASPVFEFPDGRQTLTDQFIARFKPGTSRQQVETLNLKNGVETLKEMQLPDTYLLRVGPDGDSLAMANAYYESDLTLYATPDFVRFLTRQFSPNDTRYPNQWGMENTGSNPPDGTGTADADMDASAAWDIAMGDPEIVIAIVDEGVELDHEDLENKIVEEYTAVQKFPPDQDANPNNDWDAHGTNCAGIAAAETNNNQGVAGVCPGCSLMPIQISYSRTSSSGWTTQDSWIADGLIWAVDHGADVLSNSWGGGSPSDLIDDAITHAITNGRDGLGSVVLFASGNNNGSIIYPATNNDTIAVGASSPCDQRKNPSSCDNENWWGSNYGSALDIVAPGVEWWSTDMMGSAGYASGNYFDHMNGTSSATPAAAGLAGLILSYRPCLTAAEVQDIMQQSADDQVGSLGEDVVGWDPYMGWGRINALEALLLAGGYPCPGEDPFQVYLPFMIH